MNCSVVDKKGLICRREETLHKLTWLGAQICVDSQVTWGQALEVSCPGVAEKAGLLTAQSFSWEYPWEGATLEEESFRQPGWHQLQKVVSASLMVGMPGEPSQCQCCHHQPHHHASRTVLGWCTFLAPVPHHGPVSVAWPPHRGLARG